MVIRQNWSESALRDYSDIPTTTNTTNQRIPTCTTRNLRKSSATPAMAGHG